MLSRDEILGLDDRKPVKVPVPEWSTDVFVRPMSAAERDALDMETFERREAKKPSNFRARLAVRVICREDGERLFNNDDADAVGKKSQIAVDRIIDAASRTNALTDKDVDALEKN
jgi:hypothetical protein